MDIDAILSRLGYQTNSKLLQIEASVESADDARDVAELRQDYEDAKHELECYAYEWTVDAEQEEYWARQADYDCTCPAGDGCPDYGLCSC